MIYMATNVGQMSNDFTLKDQIRRAALSSMSNIAEGFGRFSKKEFIRFLVISAASANEVKSIAYVAIDLKYLNAEEATQIQHKAELVKALDLGLIRHLHSRIQ